MKIIYFVLILTNLIPTMKDVYAEDEVKVISSYSYNGMKTNEDTRNLFGGISSIVRFGNNRKLNRLFKEPLFTDIGAVASFSVDSYSQSEEYYEITSFSYMTTYDFDVTCGDIKFSFREHFNGYGGSYDNIIIDASDLNPACKDLVVSEMFVENFKNLKWVKYIENK